MRPKYVDLDCATIDPDVIGDGVSGATFVLTANHCADYLAHKISILNNTATDHSAKTLVIVGQDEQERAQTETIAAPGPNAIVESTLYYHSCLSVKPSATIGADTFDIGFVDEIASKWIVLNWRNNTPPTINFVETGTLTYILQKTFQNVLEGVDAYATPNWETAWEDSSSFGNPFAIRVVITSYSTGARLEMSIVAPDTY